MSYSLCSLPCTVCTGCRTPTGAHNLLNRHVETLQQWCKLMHSLSSCLYSTLLVTYGALLLVVLPLPLVRVLSRAAHRTVLQLRPYKIRPYTGIFMAHPYCT